MSRAAESTGHFQSLMRVAAWPPTGIEDDLLSEGAVRQVMA